MPDTCHFCNGPDACYEKLDKKGVYRAACWGCVAPAPKKRTVEEIESELRADWTARGVSKEQQDAILADVEKKASPEYLARMFAPKTAPSPKPDLTFLDDDPPTPVGLITPTTPKTQQTLF